MTFNQLPRGAVFTFGDDPDQKRFVKVGALEFVPEEGSGRGESDVQRVGSRDVPVNKES